MPRSRNQRKSQLGNFWISKRPNSPAWCRTWFDSTTRQTRRASLGTTDVREAELKLAEWITINQQMVDAKPHDVPLETVLVRFYEFQAKEQASEVQARTGLRFWSEFFAESRVSDLTPDRLEAFIDWLKEKGHADGYVNRTLAVGRAALNRARKRQEIQNVPFIPSLAPGEPRDVYLSVEQSAALFDACNEPHILLFLVLTFNTLSRPTALLELQKDQIDFENRLIDLNPEGRKQTKKFRPTIPITTSLYPWLEQVGQGPLITYWGRSIKSVKKGFNAIRDAAGLGSNVSPYAIRHTMAIELRKRGVPPWEVQGILGHKSGGYRTTEIYAKYAPDYLGKAAQSIDEYMEEVSKRTSRPLNPALLDELRASSVLVGENVNVRGNRKPPAEAGGWNGGAGRNRTDDLYNAIVALSQLSYGPTGSRRHVPWREKLGTPANRDPENTSAGCPGQPGRGT